MEIKKEKENESSLSQFGNLDEKPKMKYFSKYTEAESNELHRIKKYHLKQLSFNTNQKDLAKLFITQRSRLKNVQRVAISWREPEKKNRIRDSIQIYKILRHVSCLEISFGTTFKKTFLTQIGKNLKSLKSLSLCFNKCKEIYDQSVIFIARMLRRFRDLEFLRINLAKTKISNNGIQALGVQIKKKLKKLIGLDLNFSSCSRVNNEGVEVLVAKIQERLENMKYLNLNLSQNSMQITGSGIKGLGMIMRNHVKNLQSLGLNLYNLSEISDFGLEAVASLVEKEMESLRSLDLNLSFCSSVTDVGFALFVKSLKGLEKLNLNLHSCKKLSDLRIQELALQIAENCRGLRQLSLDLRYLNISDKTVEVLSAEMGKSLKHLKHLEIDLTGCPGFTEDGLKILAINIGQNLGLLEHLSLSFGKGTQNKTTEGFQNRGEGMKILTALIAEENMKGLRHLQLKYSNLYFETKNEDLQALATTICSNLTDLETLNLSIPSSLLSDESLYEIAVLVPKELPKLRNLTLAFPYAQKITSQGFKLAMKTMLPSIGRLKSLDLSFNNCPNITSNGFHYFLTILEKNIRGVKSLKLDFSFCSGFSRDGVRVLESEIGKNLRRNRVVNMNLHNSLYLWQDNEIVNRFNQGL